MGAERVSVCVSRSNTGEGRLGDDKNNSLKLYFDIAFISFLSYPIDFGG